MSELIHNIEGQEPVQPNPERTWNVMTHLSPKWIHAMLERENDGEMLTQEERANGVEKEPFLFYVPYLDARPGTNDDARGIFHRFVFISASTERLNSIVTSDWNTNTRLRLTYYRDREGNNLAISDHELNQLRSVFHQNELEFFIGISSQPLDGFKEGHKVRVKLPYWEDKEGVISRITLHSSRGTASMRVVFDINGLDHEITFPELYEGDVEFVDEPTKTLLSGKVIENFEREVAIYLGHRFVFKKSQTTEERKTYLIEKRREDTPKLRRLLSFANIDIEGDDETKRFTALMLICATLLFDYETADRYRQQIEAWLPENDSDEQPPHHPKLDSATDAYLAIALFVATKDPAYRTAVKKYRRTHKDCPAIISRLYNKIRNLQKDKSGK